MFILKEYLFTFGWSLVGAVSMAVAFWVIMKVFNKMTPMIDEWEEIKKGNMAVAVVIAAVVIAASLVVANAIS